MDPCLRGDDSCGFAKPTTITKRSLRRIPATVRRARADLLAAAA